MPKLIIDNKEVEFKAGETVIQAALNAGIVIPNFCWHPGLSISGNCRICLVEIEKLPKLAIACSTLATEGMIVHTKSEKVIDAQNAVMEFLLINHPLDCPICDEAGECKLQEYEFKYGKGRSRFDEEKNHMDKRVSLGPNVMLDQERCINCSRCVRFCDEIAKDPELTFELRGENVRITTFPGKELDNPYSMNVIEICPVGALTSKHFRFRSRVWDMSFTNTICPGCARGCNNILGVRKNEILRMEPRENLDVNKWWLCDWGRLETIKDMSNDEKRMNLPMVRIGEEEETLKLIQVGWEEALSKAASLLMRCKEKTLFVASPFSTLEDNYALKKFANTVIESNDIIYFPNIDETFGDDILKRSDKTPNSTGLESMGIFPCTQDTINKIKKGEYKALYLINENLERLEEFSTLISGIDVKIFHLNKKNDLALNTADIIFSESSYAEINGTYMNFEGRIQRLKPALTTLEQERLIGEFSVSRLDKFGAHNDRWMKETRFNARPTWKILQQIARTFDIDFGFETSEDVFTELCKNIFSMDNFNYDNVGELGYKIDKVKI